MLDLYFDICTKLRTNYERSRLSEQNDVLMIDDWKNRWIYGVLRGMLFVQCMWLSPLLNRTACVCLRV